jgi:hypothetical protein
MIFEILAEEPAEKTPYLFVTDKSSGGASIGVTANTLQRTRGGMNISSYVQKGILYEMPPADVSVLHQMSTCGNYYYQGQILKPIGKRKAQRTFTVSVETPTGTEDKTTLKGATGMARLRGSASSK